MTKREMTIEEAIEIFKEVRAEVLAKETELSKQVFENLGIKAVDLAIKVLEERLEIHDTCKKCIEFSNFESQPCEDCISREAVIKIFGEVHPMDYNTQAYITNIQNLPSVTPTRPKGKWIQTKDDCDGVNFYDCSFECSKCGKEQSIKSNYCPNCGAKMEVEE